MSWWQDYKRERRIRLLNRHVVDLCMAQRWPEARRANSLLMHEINARSERQVRRMEKSKGLAC